MFLLFVSCRAGRCVVVAGVGHKAHAAMSCLTRQGGRMEAFYKFELEWIGITDKILVEEGTRLNISLSFYPLPISPALSYLHRNMTRF